MTIYGGHAAEGGPRDGGACDLEIRRAVAPRRTAQLRLRREGGEAAGYSPRASVPRRSAPRPGSYRPQSTPRLHRPRNIGCLSWPIGTFSTPPNRPKAPPAHSGEAADVTEVPLCFSPVGPSGCRWFSWSRFRAILTALSFPPAPVQRTDDGREIEHVRRG